MQESPRPEKPSVRRRLRLQRQALSTQGVYSWQQAQEALLSFVRRRIGWPIAVVLALALAVWTQWRTISALPGIEPTLEWLAQLRPSPVANGDRFSVLVLALDNDPDGSRRRLIVDALIKHFGEDEIEILLDRRLISVYGSHQPQTEMKLGHEEAVSRLRAARADIAIWGGVVSSGSAAPMRLHWSTAQTNARRKFELYGLTSGGVDLPDLFWSDLSDVLLILAESQSDALGHSSRRLVANELGFVDRVRSVVRRDVLKPLPRAKLQGILGAMLASRGGIHGDPSLLKEAAAMYRSALTVITRESAPGDWAQIKNNLAHTLINLESMDTPPYESIWIPEALSALRDAMTVETIDSAPASWAKSMTNYGGALLSQAVARQDEVGMRASVDAIQQALRVFVREGDADKWWAQQVLATAYISLARLTRDHELAVMAARLLGEVLAQISLSADGDFWLTAKQALGRALLLTAETGGNAASFEEAMAAYNMVAEFLAQQGRVAERAIVQGDIGLALLEWGKASNDASKLEESIRAFRGALASLSKSLVPMQWAQGQYHLGIALQQLDEMRPDEMLLVEAVGAYRSTLEVFDRVTSPRDWAHAQINLSMTLAALARREQGTTRLEEQIAGLKQALREPSGSKEAVGQDRLESELKRAESLMRLKNGPDAGRAPRPR